MYINNLVLAASSLLYIVSVYLYSAKSKNFKAVLFKVGIMTI